jgi:glycosyltransferase involved in cell wall biosynthesis
MAASSQMAISSSTHDGKNTVKPLRIVAVHMDFSLHWPARLAKFRELVECNGAEITIIEVAMRGSPYDFSRIGRLADASTRGWLSLFGNIRLSYLSPRLIARELWRVLDRIDPDVVLSGPIAFPAGATAVRWCRTRRRGVVVMNNARLEDVPRSRLVNTIKRHVYRNVDAMLAPATSHLASCGHFGIPDARVFFGVNVIDNEWFASRAEMQRRSGNREICGVRLPANFFLGVGRQVTKKNWPGLISAYGLYRQTVDQPWDLLLVGNGVQRNAIVNRIRKVGSRGISLVPMVTQEELCTLYATANCLVLPSYYGETWGAVVNEAMACGLPVLVSNECGCVQTLVRPGENGWQFSPHSPAELTAAMVRIASLSPTDRENMGKASQEIIREWSLDRFAEGAWAAICAVRDCQRGFASLLDRALFSVWHGRFRPT